MIEHKMNEDDMLNNETTLTGVWNKLDASIQESGIITDEEHASFRNAWYAGAFDTVHVVLNLVRNKNPEGLTVIHDEVHAYMDKVMAEMLNEESENASKQ